MSSVLKKIQYCHKCGSRSIYLDCEEDGWYNHCLICGCETPLRASESMPGNGSSLSINRSVLESKDLHRDNV